jgi:hypothetical protein
MFGSPFLNSESAACIYSWIVMSSSLLPFSGNMSFEKREQSHGAKCGDCGGCGTSVMLLLARNLHTDIILAHLSFFRQGTDFAAIHHMFRSCVRMLCLDPNEILTLSQVTDGNVIAFMNRFLYWCCHISMCFACGVIPWMLCINWCFFSFELEKVSPMFESANCFIYESNFLQLIGLCSHFAYFEAELFF